MQLLPVAWSPRRGYAARVSRFHFHRWAVIFLLVSKLIFGELTHAMPHTAAPPTGMDEVVTSVSQDAPPCGSHAQAGSESHPSQPSNTDEPAKKSCCETGGCVCPCLHSPAATAAVPFTMQRANDRRVAVLVEGAIWHRLSALFRPPA
jgi:hypothetical protein